MKILDTHENPVGILDTHENPVGILDTHEQSWTPIKFGKYVQEGKEGVFHCFTRCVRRAFLYGFDEYTRRDYSHRKTWVINRLRQFAKVFAIVVCAYAVLEEPLSHYSADSSGDRRELVGS